MAKLLGRYMNNHIRVTLLDDGTKIREVEDNEDFIAAFPETMDVNISQYCANDCQFCFVAGTQILMEEFTLDLW